MLPNLTVNLEFAQHPAALAVTGTWRGTMRDKLYAELGWELLSLRRKGGRSTLFKKCDKLPDA